ncbi:MAG: hypothetical protein JKY54_13935, partial [Flavobacteriales bacterium]|nr:hypothetical protein [Flavobacteriales bacterium]
MILSYIIYAAFIGVIVYRLYFDFTKKRPASAREFVLRNVRPILVLLIIGLSYLTIEFGIGQDSPETTTEYYEYAKKYGNYSNLMDAYEIGIIQGDRNPDVLAAFIKYNSLSSSKLNATKALLQPELLSTQSVVKDQAIIFTYAINVQLNLAPKLSQSLDLVDDRTHPYLSYYYGEYFTELYQLEQAIEYYRQEISSQGNHAWASERIIQLIWNFYPEQFNDLYYDEQIAPHLALADRFNFYFTHGNWVWYVHCYIERYTSTVNLLGFLAALIIAFLWMHYIRSFDIFEREKWWPLLLTFLLSCA